MPPDKVTTALRQAPPRIITFPSTQSEQRDTNLLLSESKYESLYRIAVHASLSTTHAHTHTHTHVHVHVYYVVAWAVSRRRSHPSVVAPTPIVGDGAARRDTLRFADALAHE